jgi:hypothetical protein
MRISLISLFFLTAFVATLLWGIGQSRELAKFRSASTIIVPNVEPHQIAFTSLHLSLNDAVVVVGDRAQGRICLSRRHGNDKHIEVLHQMDLLPGQYGVWLKPISQLGPNVEFGFACQGKTHFVSGPLQGGSNGTQRFTITGNDSRTILEATNFINLNDGIIDHYFVMVESIDRSPIATSGP